MIYYFDLEKVVSQPVKLHSRLSSTESVSGKNLFTILYVYEITFTWATN